MFVHLFLFYETLHFFKKIPRLGFLPAGGNADTVIYTFSKQ